MSERDEPWIASPSSAVEAYRWLPRDALLEIVFRDGGQAYDYPCDASLYDAFVAAPSQGRFVALVLKPHAAALDWTPRRRPWRR